MLENFKQVCFYNQRKKCFFFQNFEWSLVNVILIFKLIKFKFLNFYKSKLLVWSLKLYLSQFNS